MLRAFLAILLLVAVPSIQAFNLTASSACTTKINTLAGSCVSPASCAGGVFNNLCTGLGKCCVSDTTSSPSIPTQYVSFDQFKSMFKTLGSARAQSLYPWFNRAIGLLVANSMVKNPCEVIAAFAAQIAHESMDLMLFEELASGSAYEGRCKDLGNCQDGDGVRFKGRGAIQVTGRSNYKRVSDYFKHDFIAEPELLVLPSHGFNSAVWYWTVNALNRFCDGTDDGFKKLTRAINGGYNGLDDRISKWNNARAVLQC